MELNLLQRELIEKYKKGAFNHFVATKEEQDAFMEIIKDAEDLEEQFDAYDESGDDLILWYCKKKGI